MNVQDAVDAGATIRQLALEVERYSKLKSLYRVLAQFPHESALLFCNLKNTTKELTTYLARSGASVASLHGDLEQFDRDQVLARFRNRSLRLLVATDVAGRGIDVVDLDLVINYELPRDSETYTHRIGRTGRAGKAGLAISFFNPGEQRMLTRFEESTGTDIEDLELQDSHGELDILAKDFVREAAMDTILISGGRKDKIRPGDILGALTGDAGGLDGTDIGKIDIHERLSYVAVSKAVSKQATASLNQGSIKKKRFRATLIT